MTLGSIFFKVSIWGAIIDACVRKQDKSILPYIVTNVVLRSMFLKQMYIRITMTKGK